MKWTLRRYPKIPGLLVAVYLIVLASGCGLSDYESKMLEAQARLERYDEEARLLDDPILVPTKKILVEKQEVSQPVVPLFFRPTKGIKPYFKNPPVEGLLYFYERKPDTLPGKPAAAGQPAPEPKERLPEGPAAVVEVFVAWAGAEEKKPIKFEEFVQNVMRLVDRSTEPKARKWEAAPPGRSPLTFTTYECFDRRNQFVSLSFLPGAKIQTAVGFRVEPNKQLPAGQQQKWGEWMVGSQNDSKEPPGARALRLSLETLAVDGDAGSARNLYTSRGGKLALPPDTSGKTPPPK